MNGDALVIWCCSQRLLLGWFFGQAGSSTGTTGSGAFWQVEAVLSWLAFGGGSYVCHKFFVLFFMEID
jgi:hypothetical protein